MEAIKKAMLTMKNEKDIATDKADQLEQTFLEKKDEKEKVGNIIYLFINMGISKFFSV